MPGHNQGNSDHPTNIRAESVHETLDSMHLSKTVSQWILTTAAQSLGSGGDVDSLHITNAVNNAIHQSYLDQLCGQGIGQTADHEPGTPPSEDIFIA